MVLKDYLNGFLDLNRLGLFLQALSLLSEVEKVSKVEEGLFYH